jgi:hypothetical protein
MTDAQRLAGIVISPARTFEDINRRPSWVTPFLLLLIFNTAITFVAYRVLVTPAISIELRWPKCSGTRVLPGRNLPRRRCTGRWTQSVDSETVGTSCRYMPFS